MNMKVLLDMNYKKKNKIKHLYVKKAAKLF